MRDEILGACPVCGAADRAIEHGALGDDTFRAVPGSWTLWRCAACTCAYLDPRPDRSSIAQAYSAYYTHAAAASGPAPSWRAWMRRPMENGYLHRRYGLDRRPRSLLGALLYGLLLPYKHISDVHYRHLPGAGRGRTLLDLGCGDGGFIAQAQACGWDAEGVDPDPLAAAEGLRKGMRVRVGGLDLYAGQAERFDVITLSHVIEHVHDPVATLRECYRLLKRGGRLWIATPNIDSYGHAHFGNHWRGLEAPRHLVLFNEPALRQALSGAGFASLRRLPCQFSEHFFVARTSHALIQGLSSQDPSLRLPFKVLLAAWLRVARAWLRPTRQEFLYLAAHR